MPLSRVSVVQNWLIVQKKRLFFYGVSGRDSRQGSDAEIFERADFIDSPMASKQSDKSKRQ